MGAAEYGSGSGVSFWTRRVPCRVLRASSLPLLRTRLLVCALSPMRPLAVSRSPGLFSGHLLSPPTGLIVSLPGAVAPTSCQDHRAAPASPALPAPAPAPPQGGGGGVARPRPRPPGRPRPLAIAVVLPPAALACVATRPVLWGTCSPAGTPPLPHPSRGVRACPSPCSREVRPSTRCPLRSIEEVLPPRGPGRPITERTSE